MLRRLSALALLAAGCATVSPVGSLVSVEKDTAQQCERHCQSLELVLSAVVIIHNSTGCVCEPATAGRRIGRQGAAVGGAAAVQVIEEEQRAQQQQRQQQQQQQLMLH